MSEAGSHPRFADPIEAQRFEDEALTRPEYLSVMVHFYRGEVGRSTSWRHRLDATTNWAVLTSAGMISFAFSSIENPHVVILLSNLILLVFLMIEARRYRYFEVYRARVRMLEENFLIPVVTRHLESPMLSWSEMVAMDLDLPKYKTTMREAVGLRLRRNFIWLFLITLGGWLVKLMMHPAPGQGDHLEMIEHVADIFPRMAVGTIPPWMVLTGVLAFYGTLLVMVHTARHIHGGGPADEIAGLERNLEHWKL